MSKEIEVYSYPLRFPYDDLQSTALTESPYLRSFNNTFPLC